MKKEIWILYDQTDYERNKTFVKMLCEEIERASQKKMKHSASGLPGAECFSDGLEGKLILVEALSVGIIGREPVLFYEGERVEKPAMVIARTRDFRLSRMLERMGIKVCNSSYVCEVCNDKAITYQVVAELGIPVMETYFDEAGMQRLEYPYVVKSVDGHGGTEVFLVKNDVEEKQYLQQLKDHRFVVQRLASDTGIDVRVYVCGGKIIRAMKRQSNKDFRSNFCLGGEASVYEMDEKMISYVEKLQEHFQFDYAGIDFIFDHGEPIFNEIEDVVGARMLYTHTDIDIVKIYVDYLLKKCATSAQHT